MRRIAVTNGLFNDPERCSISRRDLRLMRAVVRLATIWERETRTVGYREANWLALAKSVRAFNAPEKRK